MSCLEYLENECVGRSSSVAPQVLFWLENEEPFPYRLFTSLYRPSVLTQRISLFFGFRHDLRSWAIDQITFVDVLTNENLLADGDFESNFLSLHYSRCLLSSSGSSSGEILFDLPQSRDFYYSDQTRLGMSYLIQSLDLIGGRYYNLSFFLENRGYPTNSFLLFIE